MKEKRLIIIASLSLIFILLVVNNIKQSLLIKNLIIANEKFIVISDKQNSLIEKCLSSKNSDLKENQDIINQYKETIEYYKSKSK